MSIPLFPPVLSRPVQRGYGCGVVVRKGKVVGGSWQGGEVVVGRPARQAGVAGSAAR